MPLRGRLQLKEQSTFFVTTSTKGHERLFEENIKKEELLKLVLERVMHHGANLYGYVIMSNHIHLLLRIDGGGPKLVKLMRDIKSLSARKLFSDKKGIWEERFDDLAIYTEEQFRIKLQYIHNNPVKAGLADRPEDYLFSSAKNWLKATPSTFVKTDLN